jgi:hypothetical protein
MNDRTTELAFEIADIAMRSDIEAYCKPAERAEIGTWYFDHSHEREYSSFVEKAIEYLMLRNRIARHPDHADWIRVNFDEGEIASLIEHKPVNERFIEQSTQAFLQLREKVRDAIAETLGDAMDCTRVWSAWSYGTMTQDDFAGIVDDESRLMEIVDAAITPMRDYALSAVRENVPEGWKPIENAPKDCRILLLLPCAISQSRVVIGSFNEDKYANLPRPYWNHELSRVFGVKSTRDNQPTHWMPLPSVPDSEGGK